MQQVILKQLIKIGEHMLVDEKQAHHLLHVMRIKDQSSILIVDNSNMIYEGQVIIKGKEIYVLANKEVIKIEDNIRINLYVALIKKDKWEFMLQKCCELGVHSITPVMCKRVVVKVSDEKLSNKYERWNKIVWEACKQCNRSDIPIVNEIVNLDELACNDDANICAYEKEETTTSLGSYLKKHHDAKSISIVIGCEGGFEESEITVLNNKGYNCVSLGKRILRAETAACAAVANTHFYFDLKGV